MCSSDLAGPTQPPIVVGGEYYTQMLPENPADFGKPVASKAVILNPSGQVVSWNVQTQVQQLQMKFLKQLHK